jgi:ankyrin repeat protein
MAIEPQRHCNSLSSQAAGRTMQAQTQEAVWTEVIRMGLIFPHYKNGLSLHHIIRIFPNSKLIKAIISLLKEKEIDAIDSSDQTAIMVAAICKNIEAMNLLFAAGANVNLPNSLQQTPLYQTILHSIAEEEHHVSYSHEKLTTTIKCLLQQRAFIDVPDKNGKTAFQIYLSSSRDPRLIAYLVSEGAEPPNIIEIQRLQLGKGISLLPFIQAGLKTRKKTTEAVLSSQFSSPALLALITAYI